MKYGRSVVYQRFIKCAVWVVVAIILISLQTTPGLFAIFGIKPLLIFPLATTFAFFEDDMSAGIYAVFLGAIWDVAAGKSLGFSSSLMLVIAIAISLLVLYLVKQNLINCVILTAAGLFCYDVIYYIFYFLIWGHPGGWTPILYHFIPTFIYTVAITPLFYYGVRFLNQKLAERI